VTAPTFDPFEQDNTVAGTAALRTGPSETTIDGRRVSGCICFCRNIAGIAVSGAAGRAIGHLRDGAIGDGAAELESLAAITRAATIEPN